MGHLVWKVLEKEDAIKKNKNLINDEIKLSRVKSKGGPTTKPRAKAPAWFIEFRDEQREFNTRIEKEVLNLGDRLDRVIKINRLKIGGQTKKSRAKAPAWFDDFINNRFSKLEKEVSSLRSDFW